MTRRGLALDAGVAVGVFGLTVGVLASGGLGTPDPRARGSDLLAVLLAAACAVPLLRPVAPMAGYLGSCAASLALVVLRYPYDFPFGPAVAVYTLALAHRGQRHRPWRHAAALAATAFVPAVAVIYLAEHTRLRGAAPGLLFWAVAFAGGWIAGDRTGLRREWIAGLEQRAVRAEQDAERERRLAAAEERTRIARELHDSAGHAINVILVQAGAARLLRHRDPDAAARAIATVEDVARDTIGEIDRLVRALREDGEQEPPPADPAALDELLQRHRDSGLVVSADLRGQPDGLPRSVAWAGYRILQEALTNAARHGAGSAEVAVSFRPDGLHITVTNPVAAGPAAPQPGRSRYGHGIIGMRERATLLGGTLRTQQTGDCYRMLAHLPYQQQANAGDSMPRDNAPAHDGGLP